MLSKDVLLKVYELMYTAKVMADIYEGNRQICKYVHSTSRGHEAIQLVTAFQLLPSDYVSPYYRDDSLLLGLGFSPYQLMLQLLAKGNDIFTGGREYYSHPNYKENDKPTIIHQSSATGMQAISTTGIAQAIKYIETMKSKDTPFFATPSSAPTLNNVSLQEQKSFGSQVVLCSLGDAAVTEGEVS